MRWTVTARPRYSPDSVVASPNVVPSWRKPTRACSISAAMRSRTSARRDLATFGATRSCVRPLALPSAPCHDRKWSFGSTTCCSVISSPVVITMRTRPVDGSSQPSRRSPYPGP